MRPFFRHSLVALCVLAGAVALADTPASKPAGNLTIPNNPKDLLNELHAANISEIQLGTLAEQRGEADQVKQLGKSLRTDHQQVDQQLKQLAQQLKVTLSEPQTKSELDRRLDASKKESRSALQVLQGQPFDQMFTAVIVVDHDRDIALLQAARANFQSNAQLTQFIDQLLPKLEQHRSMSLAALQQVQPKVASGVGGSGSSTGR